MAVALCALQASQQGFAQKHPSRGLHALVWPAGTFLHTPAWWHLASSCSFSIWLEAIPRGWDWLPERGAVLGGTGSPLGVRTSCSQVMGARAAKPCWWPLLLPTEQLGGWRRRRPQRRAAWCCLCSAVPAAGTLQRGPPWAGSILWGSWHREGAPLAVEKGRKSLGEPEPFPPAGRCLASSI